MLIKEKNLFIVHSTFFRSFCFILPLPLLSYGHYSELNSHSVNKFMKVK